MTPADAPLFYYGIKKVCENSTYYKRKHQNAEAHYSILWFPLQHRFQKPSEFVANQTMGQVQTIRNQTKELKKTRGQPHVKTFQLYSEVNQKGSTC